MVAAGLPEPTAGIDPLVVEARGRPVKCGGSWRSRATGAALGLLHPQILSLEAVPLKGGRSLSP